MRLCNQQQVDCESSRFDQASTNRNPKMIGQGHKWNAYAHIKEQRRQLVFLFDTSRWWNGVGTTIRELKPCRYIFIKMINEIYNVKILQNSIECLMSNRVKSLLNVDRCHENRPHLVSSPRKDQIQDYIILESPNMDWKPLTDEAVKKLLLVICLSSPGLNGTSFLGMKMVLADKNSSGSLTHQNMRLQILVKNIEGHNLIVLGVTLSGPAAEEFLGRHLLSSFDVIGPNNTL